ncbi:type I methionyl aminopeptidase [Magnetococcales bacterium HHB-1]
MITIKTAEAIEKMRKTCHLAAKALEMIEAHIKPGVSTDELNTICHDYIIQHNAYPSPLNYRGFPKSVCTSVNHQVCHGIPGKRVLRNGDIINVDITTTLDGYFGDNSRTFFVGKPTPKARKIVRVAKECMDLGIQAIRPGGHVGDIGAAIEAHARENRCSVVREYCGHGIGTEFHEDPAILHFGRRGTGAKLKPGMTFTVEPMINLGRAEIRLMNDKWTVVTKDHSLSAQFEHTILVTPTGFEVLTDLYNEYPKT